MSLIYCSTLLRCKKKNFFDLNDASKNFDPLNALKCLDDYLNETAIWKSTNDFFCVSPNNLSGFFLCSEPTEQMYCIWAVSKPSSYHPCLFFLYLRRHNLGVCILLLHLFWEDHYSDLGFWKTLVVILYLDLLIVYKINLGNSCTVFISCSYFFSLAAGDSQ